MQRRVAYGEGRELLVAATVDVVAAKGLRGCTFRAVAERAGVNNSLVAHHFGSRDALLAAALDWSVERAIVLTHLFDLESETAFADALMASVTEHPELHTFQYEMILEGRRNPLFRDAVARLYMRYQDVAEESLRAFGIDTEVPATARRTFAALDGIVMQYIAGVDEGQLRAAVHSLWLSLSAQAAIART